VVDTQVPNGNLYIYPDDTPGDVLQKIIYNAGRANVAQVWVAGRPVSGSG
jgi:guanine deaminase